MKKFICLAVSALLVCALLTAGVFAEHTGISNTSDTEKIDVLRLLEIVKGDENGNLNLDAPVTRAEFVKMALCASTYKDTADETLSYSLSPMLREATGRQDIYQPQYRQAGSPDILTEPSARKTR